MIESIANTREQDKYLLREDTSIMSGHPTISIFCSHEPIPSYAPCCVLEVCDVGECCISL